MKLAKTDLDRNITTLEQLILWTGYIHGTQLGTFQLEGTDSLGNVRPYSYPWAERRLYEAFEPKKLWIQEVILRVPMQSEYWTKTGYEHLKCDEIQDSTGVPLIFPERFKDSVLNAG